MLARYKEDKDDDDMEPTRKNIKMLKDQNKALHHLVHQKEEQIDLEEHKNRLIKNNYAVKLNWYAKEKNDKEHQHQEQFDQLYGKYQKELEDEKKEITERAAKSLHQQGE